VKKIFQMGDHVKVMNGRYAGETGSVVKIIEDSSRMKAIIFTDSSSKEIIAFVDDLQLSAEIASATASLKGVSLFDMISLGAQVGVVVKVRNETLDVILPTGIVRNITLQEIRAKLNGRSKSATAMDKNRNNLSQNDIVKVVAGEYANTEATIKHIYRSYVFLHSKMRINNSGVFVERARNVALSGIKIRKQTDGAKTSSKPDARRRDDALIGKTVKLKKGRFKGYLGIAVGATDDKVKVELHSVKKHIEIDRDKVAVVGDEHGAVRGGEIPMDRQSSFPPPFSAASLIGATPMRDVGAPGTPPATDSFTDNDAWNPDVGESLTDDPWAVSSSSTTNYRPPPTPAVPGMGSSSMLMTPSTPAVPVTPGAALLGDDTDIGDGSTSHGLKVDSEVRITRGPLAGLTGILSGVDGNDAIVVIDGALKIFGLDKVAQL